MELFFAEPAEDGTVAFGAVEARHISRVLRHRPGDRVSVTDGTGVEYDVELAAVGPKAVTGRVLGRSESAREPAHRLALAQAVLKGEHLAQACAQATELGIAEFIPLVTERTVGRYGPSRYERLKKVALAALKSSTRTRLPAIEARALTLEELLERRAGFDAFQVDDQSIRVRQDERLVCHRLRRLQRDPRVIGRRPQTGGGQLQRLGPARRQQTAQQDNS